MSNDHLSADNETLLANYRNAVRNQKQYGWVIDLTHVVKPIRDELLKRGVNLDDA